MPSGRSDIALYMRTAFIYHQASPGPERTDYQVVTLPRCQTVCFQVAANQSNGGRITGAWHAQWQGTLKG